jgi:hypothetical protein
VNMAAVPSLGSPRTQPKIISPVVPHGAPKRALFDGAGR